MAGADSRAVIAVEVLVKQNVIAEVRIALELLGPAEDWPGAVGLAQEQARAALRDTVVDQRRQVAAQIRPILKKPLHTLAEAGQGLDRLRLHGVHGKERDQPDHRADPHKS